MMPDAIAERIRPHDTCARRPHEGLGMDVKESGSSLRVHIGFGLKI